MTRELALTQGRVALVDDDDYDRVVALGKWQVATCDGRSYAQHTTNRGAVRLHTLLTGWPTVDHRNGDGLDNRRANLRRATPSQNAANISPPAHNTSGFKGVSWYRRTQKFRAYITCGGVQRHLGYYDMGEEAAMAYDNAAVELFGEFARLNFPKENAA